LKLPDYFRLHSQFLIVLNFLDLPANILTMNITNCPKCNTQVIPRADGICPNCRQMIADELTQEKAPSSVKQPKTLEFYHLNNPEKSLQHKHVDDFDKPFRIATMSMRFYNYIIDIILFSLVSGLINFSLSSIFQDLLSINSLILVDIVLCVFIVFCLSISFKRPRRILYPAPK